MQPIGSEKGAPAGQFLAISEGNAVVYYMRSRIRHFAFGLLLALSTSQCIKLDLSGTNLASLLAASSPSVYFFIDDTGGDGTARSFLKMEAGGQPQLRTWSGGPQNIWKAAVSNGTIYALQNDNTDDVWISRDDGASWTLFDAPAANESENITNVLNCGGNIIITYSKIAHNQSGAHPAYISRDGGNSWQEWRLGFGPSLVPEATAWGIDCTGDTLYVASSEVTNIFQWAPLSDLTSWTRATSHTVFPSDYSGIAVGQNQVMGTAYDAANFTSYSLNYSLNGGQTFSQAAYPGHQFNYYPSPPITEFGDGRFFVAIADTSGGNCKLFANTSASIAPGTDSPLSTSCNNLSNLQSTPALRSTRLGLFLSYRNTTGTQTGLLYSSDGGATLTKVDLSSVWTDSGFITDIEESP